MALGPLMEEYGVQAYFCGHEHNLQYLHKEGSPRTMWCREGGPKWGIMEMAPGLTCSCSTQAQVSCRAYPPRLYHLLLGGDTRV